MSVARLPITVGRLRLLWTDTRVDTPVDTPIDTPIDTPTDTQCLHPFLNRFPGHKRNNNDANQSITIYQYQFHFTNANSIPK